MDSITPSSYLISGIGSVFVRFFLRSSLYSAISLLACRLAHSRLHPATCASGSWSVALEVGGEEEDAARLRDWNGGSEAAMEGVE